MDHGSRQAEAGGDVRCTGSMHFMGQWCLKAISTSVRVMFLLVICTLLHALCDPVDCSPRHYSMLHVLNNGIRNQLTYIHPTSSYVSQYLQAIRHTIKDYIHVYKKGDIEIGLASTQECEFKDMSVNALCDTETHRFICVVRTRYVSGVNRRALSGTISPQAEHSSAHFARK